MAQLKTKRLKTETIKDLETSERDILVRFRCFMRSILKDLNWITTYTQSLIKSFLSESTVKAINESELATLAASNPEHGFR